MAMNIDRTDDRETVILSEKRRRASEVSKVEKHTEIFASMCPDEILDFYDNYSTREYYTTLMLGDVSGFTELAEKYTNSGKGGPSKLTETLNNYIGPMIQEILSHHGDVLKFSGDAFIVMWKVRDGMIMRDLATDAMQTACVIQKHFGTYETDVGVTLRVKLAVASGRTYFTSVGNCQKTSHYIITGKPVWDVKSAESLCRGGDILVSPSSWKWANPNEYIFKILPDGIHTLIVDSSAAWDHPKTRYNESDPELSTEISNSQNSISLFPKILSPLQSGYRQTPIDSKFPNSDTDQSQFAVDYSLRPKVIKTAKAHLKNELRSYMLRPVVRSVELDEPLEHLTEIRQVVIVFINVISTSIEKKRVISLVNAAYKLVCGIVSEMQGCVNKTSLFDKDLMFLCIFGLRGDKHDFEAQIGLRCATKLRRELSAIQNIKSVTIGVTTGMTYCGVVGHVLRREYTVIGMAVNKAARLMVAYKNKVICDRETFLHSSLDTNHFILQEPKYLKGITNVGPVYEFTEHTKNPKGQINANQFPLLSRQVELKLFKMMLTDIMKTWVTRKQGINRGNPFNVLLIRGEPRIGKTRLLDEMSQNIPIEIACNYISLVSNHRETPFALIYLIFSALLDFTAICTSDERQKKLSSLLRTFRFPQFFCALNQVFDVNFEHEPIYAKLPRKERHEILKKLVATLVLKCFNQLWVVMIDDAENADEDSLALIDTIVNQDRVFLVLSVGQSNFVESKQHSSLEEKSRVINLTGLDKWFHAGLACQMLNVAAIPAELEKIIQEKSMGNPGWIESYLLSLIQIGGIEIKVVAKRKFEEMGLVAPPSIMTEIRQFATLKSNETTDQLERKDAWKMYQASYGGSTPTLLRQSHKSLPSIDSDAFNDKQIKVCTIPRGTHLEDVNPEIAMDVVIIKLFDSLSPLDQYLLKCAAVLGETVDRNMLEKLMEGTPVRDIALAVRNLFEMRIIACAAGNFSKSRGTIIFFRGTQTHNTETKIKCSCTGLEISEIVADLPEYASCGLLRFKVATFRETTYRLLTEYQKIEFHKTALKYLQRNTRRCVSCGGGTFNKLLGKKSTESPRNSRKNFDEFDEILDPHIDLEKTSQANRSRQRRFHSVSTRVDIKEIPRTFSNIDFTSCQCNLILITAYTQILDHCRGIDRKDKSLTAILEFVEILLTTSNIPYATKLLNDAEEILNKIYGSDGDELVSYPYLEGKIKTLQGKCYFQSGLIDEALKTLEEAVQSLGYKFPKNSTIIKLKGRVLFEQQKLMIKYLRRYAIGVVDDDDAANYNDQLAKCLILAFDIFQIKKKPNHSRLSAVRALNAALSSNKDFETLCIAHANMITSAHNDQYQGISPYLENNGIKICNKRTDILESQEMKAIVRLYTGIFLSRFLRGDITEAYSMGIIARKLSHTAKSITKEIVILARLIQLLIMRSQFKQAIILLRELRSLADTDMDKSGRTWYYAFCVDLQLEAGITILPFRKCEQYYLEEGNTLIDLKDPEAERRYFTSMWLWCIRMDEWEATTIWKKRKAKISYPVDELTVAGSITALKNLEGHLILFVRRAFNQINESPMENALLKIQQEFKIIERQRHILKISLAHYSLLKAYYYVAHLQFRTSMKLLKESRKYATEMELQSIYNWADHLEKAWTNEGNESEVNNWKEVCLKSKNKKSIVLYTLPLPDW